MKVILKCVYGDKTPDTVVDLKEDIAKQLIADGNAEATVKPATKGNKDSEKIATLEEKVTALEAEKVALEEKVTAIEVAQAEIARLEGLVEEAIGLAKGTAPEGYKKD